ncbi:MAG: DUF3568 family protein [Phycisphaerales bacterium]|nr:MAG: DUF3568 family protein [Phycisphaerales bacterium]
MWMRQIVLLLCLLLLVMGSSGCLAVAVGAGAGGTVAYLAGDLETDEPYDIDAVFAAAEKALVDLDLRTLKHETAKDALSAKLMARDAGDKQVVIKLKSTTTGGTHLSIRVGTFGDDTKSQLIYDRICENLKEG